MRHIISLSTIPPRFGALGPALHSLLRQRSRPEAVELYIPKTYRRFPQWGGALPEVPEGVRIVRVEEDLGPATKVLPAAKRWLGQGIELIYVDDDRIFHQDWTRHCLDLRKNHPRTAIGGAGFGIQERYGYEFAAESSPRAIRLASELDKPEYHIRSFLNKFLRFGKRGPVAKPYERRFSQSGYTDIVEGYGGVMVQPEFFDDHASDIPSVIWAVDDIWLSGTLARRGIPIWVDRALYKVGEVLAVSRNYPLHKAVIEGAGRQKADQACIDYMRATYGIWGGEATQRT